MDNETLSELFGTVRDGTENACADLEESVAALNCLGESLEIEGHQQPMQMGDWAERRFIERLPMFLATYNVITRDIGRIVGDLNETVAKAYRKDMAMTHLNCRICKAKLAPGECCDITDGACDPRSVRACPSCDAAMGPAAAGECAACKKESRRVVRN